MFRFLSEVLALMRKYRKGLLIFCGLIVVAAIGMLTLSYELSTHSWFCGKCHYMTPYVDNWKTSSHKDVECANCHMQNSFSGILKSQFKAIASTIRYATNTHDKIPRSEIDDANCLKAGCHETRLLEGNVTFKKNILFDHKQHLNGARRGINLKCTSCHSQIVQGNHMEVTESSCFTCHFKNMPKGDAIAGCNCHSAPKDTVVHEGFTFKHAQYLKLGVQCKECHIKITSGNGNVSPERCFSCHNQQFPDKIDAKKIHDNHVTMHKVECFLCHDEIKHGEIEMVRSLEISCDNCHSGSHNIQKDMYMGIGAKDLENYPSIMFKAQVGCDGCHRKSVSAGVMQESMSVAEGQSCVTCHGKGYDTMMADWHNMLANYTELLQSMYLSTQEKYNAIKGSLEQDKLQALKPLLGSAEYNLGFVRTGHGEHNLVYAKKIMLKVQKDLNAANKLLSPDYQEFDALKIADDDAKNNCTQSCHTNMSKTQVVEYQGLHLTHNDHVSKHNMECTYCHASNGDKHGQVKLSRESCIKCHHTQESVECKKCHDNQVKMFNGQGGFDVKDSPDVMSDLNCSDCHSKMSEGHTVEKTKASCGDCHDPKYAEYVDDWQKKTVVIIEETSKLLNECKEQFQKASGLPAEKTNEIIALLVKAEANLQLVLHDRSDGAHNPNYAGALLFAADEKLRKVKELLK
ncbi:MAG: hypothetical protein HZA48_07465 [Planctomycetes bacterium]|nr:hypothetical protein [Planctomycetota bacterium]